ncbi:thymidylate synthase [Bacteroides sp.]|uniref:thymidylate synthase n=1 Tax=Bacteroides sp. TaxID=29523 RepID=UPI00261B5EED|nr:thymidylate synthase [Bacteroides sp.]MDD3039620.1 thymidylate synthase [Bacteroides sp.]
MDNGVVRPSIQGSRKMIKHEPLAFDLGPTAIQQALNGDIHPQYPQQHGLGEYCAQFRDGTTAAINSKGSQPYTYMGRTISQLRKIAKDRLLDEKFNKRIQIVTWDKFEDLGAENPPCWQLADICNIENNECEITTMFRSHDLFGAWQFNNIALLRYISEEVLEELELVPVRFVEFNTSCHVYDYDWYKAAKVNLIPAALSRQV